MTLKEYESKAAETANYERPTRFDAITYCTLGLTGEAGEAANKVKKIYRDDHREVSKEKCEAIALELGDCLWYVAMCANECGYSLEDIARMNIEKLQSRKERGVIGGSGDYR